MYDMLNIVASIKGNAQAVLIRGRATRRLGRKTLRTGKLAKEIRVARRTAKI